MKDDTETATFALLAGDGAFDPLEEGVRQQVRRFIAAIIEEELQSVLGRGRYERSARGARGHRNGRRARQVVGTSGAETVTAPRARLIDGAGRETEWRSKALRRYQRLTRKAEALIAAVYLAGTDTRRVKRALFNLFDGAVGKDVVSRAWRKVPNLHVSAPLRRLRPSEQDGCPWMPPPLAAALSPSSRGAL